MFTAPASATAVPGSVAATGRGIDVAAHRHHWSHLAQRIQNRRIADIAGVNDQLRAAQCFQRFRAQQSMRIRNQADFLRCFWGLERFFCE
jgi:hypothetical protein